MSARTAAPARPTIVITESDAERLNALALRAGSASAELLLEELERARIVPDARASGRVVRMGSTVEFEDEAHGARRTVELVWPQEADIAAGKISILTPVGAGLIGLSPGQSISWPDRDGRVRRLRVLSVAAPRG